MLFPAYYENPQKISDGLCPYRSYYIPYACDTDNEPGRENSPNFYSLNGEWDFHLFSSPEKAALSPKSYGKIRVPGNWQTQGYDKPQYINAAYPIPYDPPYVPKDNPCGLYARKFQWKKEPGKDYFLNLEGVDSAYYVYLNGRYVGFNTVSHCTGEFLLNDYLADGENLLQIFVLKWSFGTYLEGQDKIRLSGIFRDVYILTRSRERIDDYRIRCEFAGERAVLRVSVRKDEKTVYRLKFFAPDGELLFSEQTSEKEISFEVLAPVLWNAERPELYRMILDTAEERIFEQVALVRKELSDAFLLNGKKITFRGVNRHEIHPDYGYHVPRDVVVEELRLMKKHHVNAIRTAHYPPTPEFVRLCERMGFYLIEEADLECHGVTCRQVGVSDFNDLYRRGGWEKAVLDRTVRMFERDKNRFCILLWSVGNESGWGKPIEDCIRFLNANDTSRPVHYESTFSDNPEDTYPLLKLRAKMYPSLEDINKYLEDSAETRPLVLSEFSHAMGNSCGDLEDYFEKFWSNRRLMGGFVWEWCEHALRDKKTGCLLYGGDWKEKYHDGNFCVDGLVSCEREPNSSFLLMKQVYAPVHMQSDPSGLWLENRMEFTAFEEKFFGEITVKADGETVFRRKLNVSIPPFGKCAVSFDWEKYRGRRTVVTVSIYSLHGDEIFAAGEEICHQQFDISKKETAGDQACVPFQQRNGDWFARAGETLIQVDGCTGLLKSFKKSGRELFARPQSLKVSRAPLDNDKWVYWSEWLYRGIYDAHTRAYTGKFDGKSLSVSVALNAPSKKRILEGLIEYRLEENGRLHVAVKAEVADDIDFLPRFGVENCLAPDFEEYEYYGYGPFESYIDKFRHCYKDWHVQSVNDVRMPYLKPQESCAHYSTDEVILRGKGGDIRIAGDGFSFGISRWPDDVIMNTRHNWELPESKQIFVNLDYKMSGTGSGSCGPRLQEKYQLREKKFEFGYTIE